MTKRKIEYWVIPPNADGEFVARLLDLVKDQPDATLLELRDRLGIPCSVRTT